MLVPPSTNVLRLAGYYRKFIQNFASIVRSLIILLGKDAVFRWGERQAKVFESIKSKLSSEPILQYSNFEKSFIVTCDASKFACGAVSSQNDNDYDLPIPTPYNVSIKQN